MGPKASVGTGLGSDPQPTIMIPTKGNAAASNFTLSIAVAPFGRHAQGPRRET